MKREWYCGPRSWMILRGRPCSGKILSLYILAIPSDVRLICVGLSLSRLVNLSVTTDMALNPPNSGSSPIKSVPITSHGSEGTSCGLSCPVGCDRCTLVAWHFSHPQTYFATSLFILGHQYVRVISSQVLYCPGCPARMESWCIFMIHARSSESLGT